MKGQVKIMKTFSITINGVNYIAQVEEIANGAAPTVAPVVTPVAAPAAAPAPSAPVEAKNPAPKATGAAGSVEVKAPMPGNIIKVNCKVGDSVSKGDVLVVLEAMKMENDICSPEDGVVASIEVSQGNSVETDAVLVTLN